ncbi:MAG: FliM/FliN family flagellar motor switch protein [Spirochaetes bacterium]|nr:FliM/FliN family flagellar motor switch protein [Spirochaetota bacterium]
MQNLFTRTGILNVTLGKGYLSAYEVSNLKTGDVVRSSLLAGHGCPVYFNGELFCRGEIVVSGGILGIMVSGFADEDSQPSFPGVADEVTEVLPFTVSLLNLEFSLNDLKGITVGSIIYGQEENVPAQLSVAGFPAAKGKVVVVDENFGIEITEILQEIEPLSKIRQSYYLVDTAHDHRRIMYYDFRKPDMVSMNFIVSMGRIHDYFCRNMKIMFGNLDAYGVLEVDQQTLKEIFMSMKQKYTYYLFESRPVSRNYVYSEKQNVLDFPEIKYVAVSKNIETGLDAGRIESITEFLREEKKKPDKTVLICIPDGSSISQYDNAPEIEQFIINPLRSAWKNYVNLNFSFMKLAENQEDVKIIPENNMVVTVMIGNPESPDDHCILIYPIAVLEPVIEILE